MKTKDIVQIICELCRHLKLEVNQNVLQTVRLNDRVYALDDIAEFKSDFMEAGRGCSLFIVEQNVPSEHLESFLKGSKDPLVIFRLTGDSVRPEVIIRNSRQIRHLFSGEPLQLTEVDDWFRPNGHSIVMLTVAENKEILSTGPVAGVPVSPIGRLFKLLSTEKKDIGYIIIYALIIGILSLILPLGLQTAIELISGGVFFSSVYLLIGLVILGVVVTGCLQLVQLSIVEQLQRRVFVKAALEFAYRIPRVKLEALSKSYAPELVNRFFDVVTIQKGLPKLLLDLSSGAIQIIFGLLLLSLYHPFFVFFGLFLVCILVLIFYFTGPVGLQSSINESKYKYKVVQWLEELARAIKSFKLAGNTDLPTRKTDILAGDYIRYRKKHFGVLLTQFSFFVFFKVAITGGLLIMGTILVVNRQITLGQFVASEVIIILVLSAVEKMILYTDVIYDLLTAVDKVSHVTDLPLETSGHLDLPQQGKGYGISLQNFGYQYPHNASATLKNINLEIGAGERVCICGPGGSGKSTLVNIAGGLYTDYTGGFAINKFSLRDLDIVYLRQKVAKNISPDDIFDGTIYENITVGRPGVKLEDIMTVMEETGFLRYVHTLPQGLNTPLISGGKGLSSSILHRLILCRCIVKRPELIILNDFFPGLSKADKLDLIGCVINPQSAWTLLAVSNDPLVMASCDRVIVLDGGEIVADNSYEALMNEGVISKYFEYEAIRRR